jgi:hypothetical protein
MRPSARKTAALEPADARADLQPADQPTNEPGAAQADEFSRGGRATRIAAPAKRGGLAGLLGLLGVKKDPSNAPKTAGAAQVVLGASVAKKQQSRSGWLKAAALAMALMVAAPTTSSIAQTLYVNVNGAKQTSAEVLGAKAIAARAKVPFVMVGVDGLEDALAKANEPDVDWFDLILSGHSAGENIAGENPDGGNTLMQSEVARLLALYPEAAKKVRVFYGMACSVGTEENSRTWMRLFPNLKALVSFDTRGPKYDKPAAGEVLKRVDAELAKVDWGSLTKDGAVALAKRMSKLPVINSLEISFRLRVGKTDEGLPDGTTVFASKKYKATPLAEARDRFNQLRANNFEPYLAADGERYANPARSLGPDNPIRIFYNAAQDLLNALGRTLVAEGQDPQKDLLYQAVLADKESAIRLIYFDRVARNVEVNVRPKFDALVADLAKFGVKLEIPNLTKLSRHQIVALSDALHNVENKYPLTGFSERHSADIATISRHRSEKQQPAIKFHMVEPSLNFSTRQQIAEELFAMVGDEEAPPAVKEAAARVGDGVKREAAPELEVVRNMFHNVLVNLDHKAFPDHWFIALPNM